MELVSDVKLSKLECMIETENGIINCSLEEQLNHLVNSLKLLSQM
jgi:flagellar assembly protein FliH